MGVGEGRGGDEIGKEREGRGGQRRVQVLTHVSIPTLVCSQPADPSKLSSLQGKVTNATNVENYIHRVQKKGATDFFAVTFTNTDGFS